MISVKLNIATYNASDLDRNYTANENRGHLSSTWGEKFFVVYRTWKRIFKHLFIRWFCAITISFRKTATYLGVLVQYIVAQGTVNKSRIKEMSENDAWLISQIGEDLYPP